MPPPQPCARSTAAPRRAPPAAPPRLPRTVHLRHTSPPGPAAARTPAAGPRPFVRPDPTSRWRPAPTPGRPRPSGSARRSASPTTGPRAPPHQYGAPAHRRYVPARMCGVPALAYCRHSSHDRSPTAGEGSGMSRFLDIGARMAVDSELPRTPRTRTRWPREPGLRPTRPPSCAAWPMFAAEPAHCAPRAMSRSFGDSALPTLR
jgi:hypothetical protein